MIEQRPSVALTTRVLTYGSLSAAALLGLSLLMHLVGADGSGMGPLVGEVGVIVLLATPAVGLAATWSELRVLRPAHAWIALAVLLVLVLAAVGALAARV